MTPENNHSMIDVIIPPVPRTSQLISISLAIFPLHVHSFIRCYGSWCSISNDYNDLWLLSLSMSKCKSIPWCASPCPKLSVYWADFHVNVQHLLLLFILSKSKADIFFCAVLFHIRSWHYLLLFLYPCPLFPFCCDLYPCPMFPFCCFLYSCPMFPYCRFLYPCPTFPFCCFLYPYPMFPFCCFLYPCPMFPFTVFSIHVQCFLSLFSLSMSNVSFHCFLYPYPMFPFCCFLYPCPMFPFTVFSIHVQFFLSAVFSIHVQCFLSLFSLSMSKDALFCYHTIPLCPFTTFVPLIKNENYDNVNTTFLQAHKHFNFVT